MFEMLKRFCLILLTLSLMVSTPLSTFARTYVYLPEKEGAEGDPDDGNHSPAVIAEVIKPDTEYFSVLLSPFGYLSNTALIRVQSCKPIACALVEQRNKAEAHK
jgi:hypothetical protein